MSTALCRGCNPSDVMGVVSILPFHPATPIMWVTGVVGQLLMTAIHGDAPISGVPTSDSRDDGMGVLGVCPTDTGDGEDVLSPADVKGWLVDFLSLTLSL
jgi:hypothetical protein